MGRGKGADRVAARGERGARMSEAALLAVDGGATKTDLALVAADGSLLALERGPLSSPHYVGVEGSLDVLGGLLDRAGTEAGIGTDDGPVTELAQLLMAGLDLPSEVDDFHAA